MNLSAQQKRQDILEAAAAEFVERGYAAATLSSVAGRLGLTKGALAHHFPTKDALLSGLGEQLSDAIEESNRVTRTAFPDSGIHAAVAYLVQLSAIAAKDVCVASTLVLLTDRGAPPSAISELIFEWLDGLIAFLAQGQEQQQIPEGIKVEEFGEFLLATNIGTTLIPSRTSTPQNRRKRLRFLRLGLHSLGIENADQVVDDVLLSGYIDVPAINPPDTEASADAVPSRT